MTPRESGPSPEEMSSGEGTEKESSFKKEEELAQAMSDAVDAREQFPEQFGGFDTFTESFQHVDNNREKFDELVEAANQAREAFDQQVADKQGLVDTLRKKGKDALADRIMRMFGLSG